MNKKVTIQDIADALGISRNTVSKAINNSEGLADSTREKILQKAIEMGYKQFSYAGSIAIPRNSVVPTARPEASGYQGEIALLTGAFLTHSHFASLILDKFQREISQLGYTMNTHRVTTEDLVRKTLPITLHPEQVRGIICIEMFDWDYDEMLCGLDIPILFVDGPSRRNGKSNRIGFVGDYDHCQSFYERYTAFYLAVAMAGYSVDPAFIIKHNHLEEMQPLVDSMKAFPDVFICANDFVATDLLQALAAVGKRVPDDVLVCGFDDSAESRLSKPPLTTVHIHTQIIAFTAVHLLISRIQEPSLDYRTVHTQTDLIYRESTGRM